jgi:hypothetical protein
MSIDFADVVVPEKNYLGSIRHEAAGAFSFSVREVKFDPKEIRALRTKTFNGRITRLDASWANGRRDSGTP